MRLAIHQLKIQILPALPTFSERLHFNFSSCTSAQHFEIETPRLKRESEFIHQQFFPSHFNLQALHSSLFTKTPFNDQKSKYLHLQIHILHRMDRKVMKKKMKTTVTLISKPRGEEQKLVNWWTATTAVKWMERAVIPQA